MGFREVLADDTILAVTQEIGKATVNAAQESSLLPEFSHIVCLCCGNPPVANAGA